MTKIYLEPLATFLILIFSFPFLNACSDNSPVDQVEKTISQTKETAQASRAIALATQSAEKVKATFSEHYSDANATEESNQNYYTDRKNWPLILRDTFDDNRNDWPLEEDNGELAMVSWKIANGKYQWDTRAKEGFFYWTYPSLEPITDFYLSVDAQKIEGPQDGQYGLVYRLIDEFNYYLFMIDQDKNYSFQLYNEGEWFTITNGIISQAVMQDDINQIAVIGERDNFRFYINDINIDEGTDSSLSSGRSGIAVGLSYPEDQAIFEFDNFELRSPENIGVSE